MHPHSVSIGLRLVLTVAIAACAVAKKLLLHTTVLRFNLDGTFYIRTTNNIEDRQNSQLSKNEHNHRKIKYNSNENKLKRIIKIIRAPLILTSERGASIVKNIAVGTASKITIRIDVYSI